MKLLILNYNGSGVTADRKAWFNATEIAAMFGKRPIDWLRLPDTERYIAALCKAEAQKQNKPEVRKSHFVKTIKGGNDLSRQGTWLHPKLAVAFARWCDVDFAVWCDEQIEEIMSGGKAWESARAESKLGYQIMSEILQASRQAAGKGTQSHHYSNEALLCNEALTGKREAIDRAKLDKTALKTLIRLEAQNSALIGQGLPYQERKQLLFTMAAPTRAAIQQQAVLTA
ncbi:MAG: KilA-N domain-containing protein [Neisseria sp.]|uniref:KilA-N domain-containing protein n=1 Tax=Neisseria sp. TaxID=192066 RepID=UPI0026DC7734|nr:KilA-N domain-containing protein [Neisseria sp.]MDO4247563.1 KilA-N domain-containing protein [Neisseria sp.]